MIYVETISFSPTRIWSTTDGTPATLLLQQGLKLLYRDTPLLYRPTKTCSPLLGNNMGLLPIAVFAQALSKVRTVPTVCRKSSLATSPHA